MSNSLRPRGLRPTRLLHPDKYTGVCCHFLLQCMKVKVKSLSCVRLLGTPWTAAYQAPPFMGFSRQEYWSGVSLPSPTLVLEFINLKTEILYHLTSINTFHPSLQLLETTILFYVSMNFVLLLLLFSKRFYI